MRPNFWSTAPIVKLLFPFLCAIIYVYCVGSYAFLIGGILVLLGILVQVWYSFQNSTKFMMSNVLPLIFLGLSFIYVWQIEEVPKLNVPNLHDYDGEYEVVLLTTPKEKSNSFCLEGRILNLKCVGLMYPLEQVYIYVPKKDVFNFDLGDTLVFSKKIQPIKNWEGASFNYQQYCLNKGIIGSVFLSSNQCKLKRYLSFDFFIMTKQIQHHLSERVHRVFNQEKHAAMLDALLLGIKDNLDDETKEHFANVGVVHVLAVSGLHVGIIYLLLSSVFAFLARWPILRLTLILFGVWMFAIIAGLSHSITRACLMFTIIELGKAFAKRSYTFNAVGLSALIILMLRPNVLFDIGFQLSYAAVLGILFFQPYCSFSSGIKWVNKGLGMAGVTVSAQMGTLPFTLFYFKQFPTFFLIANVLVLPLIPLVIYVSLFALFLDAFAFDFLWVTFIVEGILDLIVWMSAWMSNLPHAVIELPHFGILNGLGVFMLLFMWLASASKGRNVTLSRAFVLFLLGAIVF